MNRLFIYCLLITAALLSFSTMCRAQLLVSRGLSSGPLTLNLNRTTTDVKCTSAGIALNFGIYFDFSKYYVPFTDKDFIDFVSVGANAMSGPYLLNPNEWQLQMKHNGTSVIVTGISGWSNEVRYGDFPNEDVKELLKSDKQRNKNYVYRWRFSGTAYWKDSHDFDIRASINIEIQRKSYFSENFETVTDFRFNKASNQAESISNLIVYKYNSWFKTYKGDSLKENDLRHLQDYKDGTHVQ